MPIKPNSIVPELIESIFEKYTKLFEEQSEKGILNKDSYSQLFIELDAIFGDIFKIALRLIDEQIITIYTNEKQLRSLAEITEGRRSQRVVKLLTNINYCQCEFFTKNVLQLEVQTNTEVPATSSTVYHPQTTTKIESYTCQHVLALKLVKLLQETKCLRQVNLPSHQFNYLLKQFNTNLNANTNASNQQQKKFNNQ